MSEPDAFTVAFLVIGTLLIARTLGGSFISRLPLSSPMLYLCVGMAMGPWGLGLLSLDPIADVTLLERLTEIAVLISLFTAGMKLELPLTDRRWRIPVQLATVSMLVTVGCVAALGVWGLGMSLGGAVLLGAILAPTDPVLASDVQVSDTGDRDRLRFGLTGEGGMNDGTAFPLVMLGLGLLGLHELGEWGWRWWSIDVLWAIAGGLGLGAGLGALVGWLILYLRMRHREALGSDEFIALGLIALTYGLALSLHTYGFLAVFAAGLALQRVGEKPPISTPPTAPGVDPVKPPDDWPLGKLEASSSQEEAEEAQVNEATGPQAPAQMMLAVQRFNTQLESFVEVGLVLAVGVLLASVEFRLEALWFSPLLFLVIRPLSVVFGLVGTQVKGNQRGLIAWFGIRGIGSLYYLFYAISHGVKPELAQLLLSMTVAVVVASAVLHGISVTPLMNRYEARKKARVGARSA